MSWEVWVDTGGTFTDCLARDPSGALHRAKVLSTGRLRGIARTTDEPSRISVDLPVELPARFLEGCSLSLLGSGDGSATIVVPLYHLNL